ncbi:uncharacterized protein [Nicotiana sylvestris]|uniref:uncharacterized protein n=1 Tax=Nicotiana sylvestris TaxID=4096 RepID=UPI00388CC1EB
MVEGSVNKLSMANGEPSVVVKEGSPSNVAAKQEKSKVVVTGMTNKPIIIVEGARMDPVIIKHVNPVAEELRKAKTSRDNLVLVKKAVTEEEAEEFLRKMKSDEHRRTLTKILNEAHVPDKISVNHLEKIARVTFSDDELPMEGTEHNKALYLTVKCEDSMVARVLVDNGSSANICPLSTLNKLRVDDKRIHKNNICVRGFDGRGKDSVGDIVLELTIGPVEFTMEFQVPEGKCVPTPKIVSASAMVAIEMLKNGFVPGKGLGASLQGIIQPVSLPENLGTFGLGFKPTSEDMKRDKRLKHMVWTIPKPVPRLSRSFVKPDSRKRLVTTVPSSVVDIDYELIEREEIIKALFEYKDILVWSYDDMPGLRTNLVVHKFPVDPAFPPVKETLRNFKTDISVKIKEEVTKQLDAKSRKQSDHVRDLRKFFQRLRRYNLNLNPAKCAFGVPSGKLLGFIVSRRGIELGLSKIKSIQELPPLRNKTEVMSLLGRLNYISRFIAQLMATCEPIFKLLKKDTAVKWTDECQEAFDKIKEYLSKPPALDVLRPDLGNTEVEALFVILHYLPHRSPGSFEQNPMPTGRLAKWQILLTKFDIVYVTRTAIKAQALSDHLAENPVDEEYEPLRTYFPDEEHVYCNVVEEELDGELWFYDIRKYIRMRVYPVQDTCDQKRTIRHLANGFFLSGGVLYKRTPDLGLLRSPPGEQREAVQVSRKNSANIDTLPENKGKAIQVLVIRIPPGEQREAIQVSRKKRVMLVISSPPGEQRESNNVQRKTVKVQQSGVRLENKGKAR